MTTKRFVKTNQNIIGGQCMRNNDGVQVVSDQYHKITLRSYYEKLLKTEFVRDDNSLPEGDAVI